MNILNSEEHSEACIIYLCMYYLFIFQNNRLKKKFNCSISGIKNERFERFILSCP